MGIIPKSYYVSLGVIGLGLGWLAWTLFEGVNKYYVSGAFFCGFLAIAVIIGLAKKQLTDAESFSSLYKQVIRRQETKGMLAFLTVYVIISGVYLAIFLLDYGIVPCEKVFASASVLTAIGFLISLAMSAIRVFRNDEA